MQQFYANGLAMPRKMDVRQIVGNPSKQSRDLFDTGSHAVREMFEYCSAFTEADSNNTRRNTEVVPNLFRSRVEARPKGGRTTTEETGGFFGRFLRKLKGEVKQQASDPITTQDQPKNDLRITQQPPKVDPSLTQETAKDDLRLTQQRPSLRTGYRQGSPKDGTTNTQETANNDTRNAPLMYCECTVSVRGVYRKGTREVLKRYWRPTKDPLNACTSGVDQQYSKSRRLVAAMTNKSMPFVLALICFSLKNLFFKATKNKVVLSYGLLCFMLFDLSDAWAQSAESRTAEGQTEIKPLKIGDTIPEELWRMPLQVVNHPDGHDTITLNDYRDKKLIILDFWTTWCAPCIKSLTELEKIIPLYKDSVALVATSYESKDKVKGFVKEREFRQHYVFEDTVSREYFPHKYVPHQIWIVNGKIRYVTGSVENLGKVIQDVLADKPINLKQKDDLFLDFTIPFENYANERNAPVLMKSIFTGYVDGTGGYGKRNMGDARLYYYLNRAILSLYKDVANIPLNEILLEVDDEYIVYQKERGFENAYCYLFYAPLEVDEKQVRIKMLTDLNFYLGYNARFEKRYMPCKVLRSIRTNNTQRDLPVREGGKYITLQKFVDQLNYNEEWSDNLVRYINSTDDAIQIWIKNNREVQTLKAEPEELESRLAEFGIGLSAENKELDYFVISNSQ